MLKPGERQDNLKTKPALTLLESLRLKSWLGMQSPPTRTR